MKKRLFCCLIAILVLVTGCAELPAASYADGSPVGGEGEVSSKIAAETPSSAVEESSESDTVDPDALRICLDLSTQDQRDIKVYETMLANNLRTLGGPENIVFDSIPAEGSERKIARERIRMEIMAGGGPDVFIVTSTGGSSIFPVPEKVMREGMFLPLDDYIPNAKLSDWDKLTPAVLEAGRTDEGQQLVPMIYTLPVSVYLKSSGVTAPPAGTTWKDMAESETKALRNAAVMCRFESGGFECWPGDGILSALGSLADYETGELLFTEEELLQYTEELLALEEEINAEGFDALPDYFQGRLAGIASLTSEKSWLELPIGKEDPLTMIPLYSDDGGVTATVQAYTCISRNTKHPEEAFFIVDYLMSADAQQNFKLYYMDCQSDGLPVHEDVLSKEYPQQNGGFCFSDENFAEVCRVRDQISETYFDNELTGQLTYMYMIAQLVRAGEADMLTQMNLSDDLTLEQLVSETYGTMKQILSE